MLQTIEISIICGLILWQFLVYRRNRQLIWQVAAMYPTKELLGVERVELTDPTILNMSERDQLRSGQAAFKWTLHPEQEFCISGLNEEGRLHIDSRDEESSQWISFARIGTQSFDTLYSQKSIVFSQPLFDTTEYDAVKVSGEADVSPQFARIAHDTNDYLLANKGAAAAFDTLRDISEREANLLDEEIQAQISTPLYLGLLGTFGGAILGLIALVNPFSATGPATGAAFDNADVTEFLGGVLIAMVGSIVGLSFTLAGNQQLKTARTNRDRLKNAYYNFLQKALLPKLNSDMQQSMSSLKAVLDTFNQDFFSKIQTGFFSKIAEFTPLIGAITANITIQKDFLEKLQSIGYTQLANATIKVFDRVDESAASFEKFLGYQQALNVSVSKGAETVATITTLLNRLTNIEKALDAIPSYLQQHDAIIRSQVSELTQHTQLLDMMRDGIHQALTNDAAKMYEVLENRREAVAGEAKAAHEEWKAYIDQLKKDNIYQKITEYLNPFQQLPAQQQALNKLQEEQARRSAAALTALEQRIGRDEQVQQQLTQLVTRTNELLTKMSERSLMERIFGGNKPAKPNSQPAPPKNRQPQPEA